MRLHRSFTIRSLGVRPHSYLDVVGRWARFLVATGALALGFGALPASAADTNCPYHKVKWDDFKGPAPTGEEDAEISGGVSPHWEAWSTNAYKENGKWKCKLSSVTTAAYMDKTASGVKTDAKTDGLLQHEQYHLDIYQYWAREMEKALKGVVGEGNTPEEAANDALAKAQKVAEEQAKKCDELQEQYDTETDHSRKGEKQKEWCTKVGNLLNPPAPKDNKSTSHNSRFNYNPNQRLVQVANVSLQTFSHNDTPLGDPYLEGALIVFPPLVFVGYHMETSFPLAIADSVADFFIIPQNTTLASPPAAARGKLHVLCGDSTSTSFTGWIEELEINPSALALSPFLQQVEASRQTGQAIVTVEVRSTVPWPVITANWTQPAMAIVTVILGTSLCDPASPFITQQPASASVAPGQTTNLSVFVAAAGPFTYQWRKNGEPIANATNEIFTVNGAQLSDAGIYDVTVASPCGTTTSSPAILAVGNVAIPTLSEWGEIVMALLLLGGGSLWLWHQQRVAPFP